jgi:hypothetical protein
MVGNAELQHARETYAYVPAKLIRASEGAIGEIRGEDFRLSTSVPPPDWHSDRAKRRCYSSLKLDDFHSELLASDNAQALLHGLLSVVFWGYVSGTDGRIHSERALKRTRWHLDGKINSSPQQTKEIIVCLKNARALLEKGKVDDALIEVIRIKFIGMAFGSKVLTFMNPCVAAVYDEVIRGA